VGGDGGGADGGEDGGGTEGGVEGSDGGTGGADGGEDGAVDPEGDGFYLHENGVTVLCPDVAVGATGVVEGREFTKRDEALLVRLDLRSPEWVVSCTSGVTDLSEMFSGTYDHFNQDIGA
jgi:hypothetical protein